MIATIRLDPCEVAIAKVVAQFRIDRVESQKLGPGHGELGNGLHRHFPGAAAELAVAKHFGVYWAGSIESWTGEDVAGLEVRSTKHVGGSLILYPSDDPDKNAILVVVLNDGAECRLIGTIPIRYGQHVRYSMAGDPRLRPGSPPQFWVPQNALLT